VSAALRALAAGCALVLALAAQAAEPVAAREVHGAGDAFAEPGIALAWAVLRGRTEDATLVTLRIVAAEGGPYRLASVTGVHPFSQQRRVLLQAASLASGVTLRIPRAQFADFPRTEIRLYRDEAAAARDEAALVILYFGVPDTTPEFADAAALDADVAARLERARTSRSRSP
jgi:hypothetical protein